MPCRYAARFLAVNGAGALSAALGLARPPFSVIRFALAALEAATRACGPAGCELALGWWAPALTQLPSGAKEDAAVAGQEAGAGDSIGGRDGNGQQGAGSVKPEPMEEEKYKQPISQQDEVGC